MIRRAPRAPVVATLIAEGIAEGIAEATAEATAPIVEIVEATEVVRRETIGRRVRR